VFDRTCYFISGCSVFGTSETTAEKKPLPPAIVKDPAAIALYFQNQHPASSYKVIGKQVVSKFNLGGIRRQEAIIKDILRNQAAELGGDAVINVQRNEKYIQGTIITFNHSAPTKNPLLAHEKSSHFSNAPRDEDTAV
jgi:hypothetical protein